MTKVQSHHHTCNRSESNGHTEIHQAQHHIDFRPTPTHTLGTIIPQIPKADRQHRYQPRTKRTLSFCDRHLKTSPAESLTSKKSGRSLPDRHQAQWRISETQLKHSKLLRKTHALSNLEPCLLALKQNQSRSLIMPRVYGTNIPTGSGANREE